jgi:hypothetical protein
MMHVAVHCVLGKPWPVKHDLPTYAADRLSSPLRVGEAVAGEAGCAPDARA